MAWAERSNRVGKLRGKTLTPTAEALVEQLRSPLRDTAGKAPEGEGRTG